MLDAQDRKDISELTPRKAAWKSWKKRSIS